MNTGTGTGSTPQVLLVDGMSVLVRAAKAASRIRPLSYRGVPTGTLLMFAGTLARHLAEQAPDYAVICWEGQPALNWRREFYPEYKSNRPAHDDGLPVMSQDEELAQEFCDTAGLHQDTTVTFEGDDIIAAWWRAFRAVIPAARITILTSDRDLLQLCDEATVCRAWADEVTTAEDVRRVWGVGPERLALMRALAGDASDGIPGVRGYGPSRARAVALAPESPLAVIHSLGPKIGLEQQAEVYAWYVISELREPVVAPELFFEDRGERARWRPEKHSRALREFLGRFGMERMAARLDAGKLPWPPVSE